MSRIVEIESRRTVAGQVVRTLACGHEQKQVDNGKSARFATRAKCQQCATTRNDGTLDERDLLIARLRLELKAAIEERDELRVKAKVITVPVQWTY